MNFKKIMEKWYKVLAPFVVGGKSTYYQIAYKEGLIEFHKDAIILKEYSSKEEMLKDLSK